MGTYNVVFECGLLISLLKHVSSDTKTISIPSFQQKSFFDRVLQRTSSLLYFLDID